MQLKGEKTKTPSKLYCFGEHVLLQQEQQQQQQQKELEDTIFNAVLGSVILFS